jgi:hypothetical protein
MMASPTFAQDEVVEAADPKNTNPVDISFVWLSPAQESTTVNTLELTVQIGILSEATMESASLLVNGKEQRRGSLDLPLADQSKYRMSINRKVTLVYGRNEIEIAAVNESGMNVRETRIVTVTK